MNLLLFKKLLRDIGIKFHDIQSNWIDATSCPEIYCSFTFDRKHNSVDISLEQHSLVKQHLYIDQYIQELQN